MTDYSFPDVPLLYLVNRDCFQLTEDYPSPEVTVPKGLITDGASAPRWLQALFPAYYKYFPAAMVHDYMYGSGLFEKSVCDDLFRDNMRYRLGLSWRYWLPMYWAVRLFGAGHYTKRTTEGNLVASVTPDLPVTTK